MVFRPFLPVTVGPCPFSRPIRGKLTVAPLDHMLPIDTPQFFKSETDIFNVSLIRSEKVSSLGGVQRELTMIVNLRCAFEDCAPYPNHTLNWLLCLQCRTNEFVVAHHACVMAEPTAHENSSRPQPFLSFVMPKNRNGYIAAATLIFTRASSRQKPLVS